jgi:hypothetical protein
LLFAFCCFLALVHGESEQAVAVIGLAALGLGGAGLNQRQGPKAAGDLWLLAMIMKLIRR